MEYSVKEEGRVFPQVTLEKLRPLPIMIVDNQQPIEKLVDKILDAKRLTPASDTSALEKEIDFMVYKLYNLTEEEINLIENKNK